MMDIQKALVHIGACESYKESAEAIVKGLVTLNGKRIDCYWKRLRGGYYAINVKEKGLFRFNVRSGKVGNVKRGFKQ
ncbi:hypothetical protein AB1282_00535 [Gottfriedia sp. S16(2024)]|uniref:hypothetical protein n=1 Tax=Gottfriedia sp. S16(2024) TaxID=3162883 RepID=UPI003D2290A8